MKRQIWPVIALALVAICARPAAGQSILGGLLGGATNSATTSESGVIVRTNLGALGLQGVCILNGCTVVGNLDGSLNQVFLVRPIAGLLPNQLAGVLRLVTGILDAEIDQSVAIPTASSNQAQASNPPGGLWDNTPVSYYGTTVPDGYVNQPATQIIRLSQTQTTFNATGSGVIADIDTGVDPNHPALQGVLLTGYDFTRNQPGGSEMTDVQAGSGFSCSTSDPCEAAYVNQHTAAMVDQHTAAMVDGNPEFAAFGHGTMVAGILHLVAPTAKIMPLKSFHADGTANLSDILRAVYYAVQNNANVINMSFNLTSPSQELANAIQYATNDNLVCAASSGNDGEEEVVYPAGLSDVMGVASTNDEDQRSTFSNYGDQVVWVAAPGEAVITTYPFGFYAAGWGTSFSSPMVAAAASLVGSVLPLNNQSVSQWAIGHAKWIGQNMGEGRLDLYLTLSSANPVQATVSSLLP